DGTVAEHGYELGTRSASRRAQCVAGPGSETTVRPRIEKGARKVRVDVLAGVGDEVAAVADDDRVAIEHRSQLTVDARRRDRRGIRLEARPLRVATLLLLGAQLLDPILMRGI